MAGSAPSGKWRYWVIFIVAIMLVITSGITFFTAKYKMKKDGQETEVRNISGASLANFIMSIIIGVIVGLVIFFPQKISAGLSYASKNL